LKIKTKDSYEWVYLWQANEILKSNTGGIGWSESTWRRCRDENKYGIVFGKLGNRIVVRVDTIPQVIPEE